MGSGDPDRVGSASAGAVIGPRGADGWADPSAATSRRRVSFVVTSRNDDVGGDMLRRLRLFTENVVELAARHCLPAEVIIVEWNPPDGPRLYDVLHPRVTSPLCPIRFIEVPPAVHRSLRNADVLPLFQMIAKNVGIRRATGEFVCATNQDILFSDELFAFLATQPLETGRLYRVDRYDVRADIPERLPLDAKLAWCRANVIRIHRQYVTREVATPASEPPRGFGARRLLSAGASRLQSSPTLRRVYGWLARRPMLHTNACGDFTVLAREQWLALRGYPELPLYSLHLDSLLCYAAAAAGVKQRILSPPAQIFHLEHGDSWAVMSPEDKLRWFALRPWIDYRLLQELSRAMYTASRPIVFNPETWGLGDRQLDEQVIGAGARQPTAGHLLSERR